MSINLTTVFKPLTDEKFATDSKLSLVTNKDFDWTGAHTVKIYKISTASMTDYGRDGPAEGNWSRFGAVSDLNATTEELTLTKDRSFTFTVDKLDVDETAQQLQAAKALARQLREVTIPEIDAYVYGVMATGAGTKATKADMTASNIYGEILAASKVLDDAEVPEEGRVLVVTPDIYRIMKQSEEIVLNSDVGNDLRLKGVISNLDGMHVQKIPANRLPAGFGFMVCHPVATVAPVKLEDYRIQKDPPGISGDLVEGRVCYDAFVLDNKVKAIYYQSVYVYTAVKTADLDVDDIGTYYELVNGVYVKTEDVALAEGKTYYTRA